jgi:opacity protein-like surface antigen
MLCLRLIAATTGALITALAGAAHAADMPRDLPPLPAPPPPLPVDWQNWGWYLRGDAGWYSGVIGGAQGVPGFADPTNNKLGTGITAGGGAGIKTRWLRTDFTIDYASPAKYNGTIAAPDDVTAKIQSLTFLFNGYIDLGTWYRITPYIGAGAGPALVRVGSYQNSAPPFAGSPSHSQWNFAYAGMAGIGWAITPNTMIDVGYRYLNVGNVNSPSDANGSMTFKSVGAHEVRVGLRWSFDDLREFQ